MRYPNESPQPPTSGANTGRILAIMAGVLALFTWFAHGVLEDRANPNKDARAVQTQAGVELRLQADRSGHYYAPGVVNGERVKFLLDTGATDVAFPLHLAERLGLPKLARAQFSTANGLAEGWLTRIDELDIGGIVMRDVRGSIVPGMQTDEILLGMSALRHLELTHANDMLIIRP